MLPGCCSLLPAYVRNLWTVKGVTAVSMKFIKWTHNVEVVCVRLHISSAKLFDGFRLNKVLMILTESCWNNLTLFLTTDIISSWYEAKIGIHHRNLDLFTIYNFCLKQFLMLGILTKCKENYVGLCRVVSVVWSLISFATIHLYLGGGGGNQGHLYVKNQKECTYKICVLHYYYLDQHTHTNKTL
jgi:hypothetical protein